MLAIPEMASAKGNKKVGIQLYSVMDAVRENPKASIERLAGMG
ncbi:MAG TPA: sugar phosphate isomerase, partial [Porphyromonadaceae bacterium]|nr:sugar phosphate isomerase [Porphyromonadaceae bacterium]